MSKKGNKLPIVLAIAAVGAYRFYTGKGGFNRLRFQAQHNAVCKYLETHYPDAFYSDIVKTEKGWSCVVTYSGGRIVLYFKASGGNYIFWEEKM